MTFDNLLVALRGLLANRMRSMLTMLGILIGTAPGHDRRPARGRLRRRGLEHAPGQAAAGFVSPGAVVVSFGVSALVGVFFGLYPASQAAKLRPIEALRFE